MRRALRTIRPLACVLTVAPLIACAVGACTMHAQTSVERMRKQFLNPPDEARPMMRWWWFGPAVTHDEIARELEQMHSGGIGGVELASVYPLGLDDASKGIKNFRYTSPDHLDALKFAAERGRALGMRVDITLGSGWPFGGPHIPIEQAAGRLKIVAIALPAKAQNLPPLAPGDSLVAAFEATGTAKTCDPETAKRMPRWSLTQRADLAPSGQGEHVALFFIASHTRQMVKRASVGGEGFVLDHMSRAAIDTHLRAVGNKLLSSFDGHPPFAIFSDSLEVYGSDWTTDLPAEFKRRRGYDLVAHLPELAMGHSAEADAVRHDWGVTLSDLVRENYLQPLTNYAHAHGTRFRSQTYGEPAATLSDVRTPDLPEGEGPQWDAFSFTRWTSSANHIFGRNITSAETWTWLHSPAFRATPLDMKAEADRMFLEGVNQIIGHGWPYSAASAQEPGWSLYAAAVFNAHNPWWPVMPDVMRYLQRVSWLMRQGEPANDVALLLPEDDAQAAFVPGHVSVTEEMKKRITPELMHSILSAGYNVDYIDNTAIEMRGVRHPVLVVPPTHRMSLAAVQRLAEYARGGGKIIVIGEMPSLAGGLQDAKDSDAVRSAIGSLRGAVQHVASATELGDALHHALHPDWNMDGGDGSVGFIHRHSAGSDIYFVANTSPKPQAIVVAPRAHRRNAEWWNPDNGTFARAKMSERITLAPYASRVLVLDDSHSEGVADTHLADTSREPLRLADWTADFVGGAGSAALPARHVSSTVWTEDQATKFYSGEVRYATHFDAPKLSPHERAVLRFAPGVPQENTQAPGTPGMRAWLDAPVRDAAIVLINGKRVGSLWHPPYELDVTAFLPPGMNQIEIRVFNTAINELAGQSPRDYSALTAKYGERFQMQDMNGLQPVTSGIVGPVTMHVMKEVR